MSKTVINLTYTVFGDSFEDRQDHVESFSSPSAVEARVAELRETHGRNVQAIRRFSGGRYTKEEERAVVTCDSNGRLCWK